jgi:pimeloyl-ACP methyl ester carboxylesterase
VSQGLIQSWWLQGMMSGHKNAYDCIKAFSETDFTEDLKKFDVPTLIIHGDDDQIVPIGASAMLSSKLVKNAVLKIYPGGTHSLVYTLHQASAAPNLTCGLSVQPAPPGKQAPKWDGLLLRHSIQSWD